MDLIKRIRKGIRKVMKLLEMIELLDDGNILIRVPKSLLIEADYLVISTERKSIEDLGDIKKAYDNTKDGVMYRTSSSKISTDKETGGCNTR